LHGLTAGRLRQRIETTLDELGDLSASTGGDVEIRVAPFAPQVGINAIDVGSPDGLIVVQHYEHRPMAEAAPIFSLRASDGVWYEHFAAEAERMWADGIPWPAEPEKSLRRAAHPLFTEAFGPELALTMNNAKELLITGVTRNTLIRSNYNNLEDWLRNGCRIRKLLIDPSSDAIAVAAERYYAGRSPGKTRQRAREGARAALGTTSN
jgi:hypothetical protein